MIQQNNSVNHEAVPYEDPLVIDQEDANLISLMGSEERANIKNKAYNAIFKDSLNRAKQN